jgi:membrane protein DedA with SNARE-associated domain
MVEVINQIAEWIQQLILTFGYPGVFGVMFVENVFPPVPTDPLLPFAGLMAAQGKFVVWLVWLSAVAGAVAGSLVLYAVGAWMDEPVVRGLLRRWGRYLTISERELDRVLALFNRYGAPAVFIGRSIPVMRSVVSLTAGMSRMPLGKFVVFTSLSSGLVTGFWTMVGYVLGENWTLLLALIEEFEPLLIALLVVGALAVVGIFAWRLAQGRRLVSGE